MIDVEWFKRRMKELGLTQKQLGEEFGRDRSKVSRIFGGQKMTVPDAEIFSKALQVPVGEILKRAGAATNTSYAEPTSLSAFVPLEVVGYVQAGLWRGADEIAFPDRRTIFVPRITGANKLFALEVRGDSMNEILKPGTIVVCQDFFEYPGEMENELLLIVERHDHGLIESTVKELYISPNGTYHLVPRSTNKSFEKIDIPPPDKWNGMEGTNIRILGVVITAHQNMLPGR